MNIDLSNVVLQRGLRSESECRAGLVCIMQLVSMLSGFRPSKANLSTNSVTYTDRPLNVCPRLAVYASHLNDGLRYDNRQTLIGFAHFLKDTYSPYHENKRKNILFRAALAAAERVEETNDISEMTIFHEEFAVDKIARRAEEQGDFLAIDMLFNGLHDAIGAGPHGTKPA